MGIVFTVALALAQGVLENQVLTPKDAASERAIVDIRDTQGLRIRKLVIDGQRDKANRRWPIAQNGAPFIDYYPANGIAIDNSRDVVIEDVIIRNVENLAIVVARSRNIIIRRVTVEDSGSLDARGRNNTTGGILLEEGTTNFEVRDCRLTRIRGNAIWTHSYSVSPRNSDGLISKNEIDTVGRDAIQVGHATRVQVEDNVIRHVGYPVEIVDVENHGYPVGVDTAGNVDETDYSRNRMFEVNGKCFDLDGFHDGRIRGNLCINTRPPEAYPNANLAVLFNDSHPDSVSRNITVDGNTFDGMIYGGIFLYGSGHRIENNQWLNLNRAKREAPPGYLRSGFYFAGGVLRPNPPRGILVRGNTVRGYGMKDRCREFAEGVEPGGVKWEKNVCEDAGAEQ